MTRAHDRSHALPIPQEVVQPLQRLRELIYRYVWWQGWVLALSFLLVCFWVFAWIDYFPIKLGIAESPRWARLGMLVIAIGGTLGILWTKGLRKVFVRWPDSTLALLLEKQFPVLQGTLSTLVDNSADAREVESEPELRPLREGMLQETLRLARTSLPSVDPIRVLRWGPLYLQSWGLGFLLLGSCAGSLWQPVWVRHWVERFLALSDRPWPRDVKLQVNGVELEVPPFSGELERPKYLREFSGQRVEVVRGQGAALRISADKEAKRVPEFCTLFYETPSSGRGRANFRRLPDAGDRWLPFLLEGPPFEAIQEPLFFSVLANDSKLTGYAIDVVEAPLLSSLRLQVEYPRYLQETTRGNYLPETLEYRTGIRIPQGTLVTLLGTASQNLSSLDYARFANGDLNNGASDSIRLNDAQFTLPLGSLNQNALLEFRPWNASGLCTDRVQQYLLSIIQDEPPQVEMRLEGIGTAITPSALLPVRATLQDDYGVRDSALEIAVNSDSILRFSPSQIKENETGDLQGDYSLDLRDLSQRKELEVAVESSLSLTVSAEDHAGTNDMPHVGRASPIQLKVVSPEKLLVMLEKRELAMRMRLELTISELEQMRLLLNELEPRTKKDPSAELPSDQEPGANADQGEDASDTEKGANRLRRLRIQQCQMQAAKSRAELQGLALEIHMIRLELQNNRIDSQDRQARLEEKIYRPLVEVDRESFEVLIEQLSGLEREASENSLELQGLARTHATTEELIRKLREVLANMVDIQDFNELIDMVRDVLRQQEGLLEQTRQEQKRQVMDLFKK